MSVDTAQGLAQMALIQGLSGQHRGGVRADPLRTVEQLIQAQCQIRAVLGRAVRIDRAALIRTLHTSVGGDERAVLEDLDQVRAQSHIDTLADECVRHRVVAAGHFDVMVAMNERRAPLGVLVTALGKGLRGWSLVALEQLAACALALLEGFGVDLGDDRADRRVEIGEREEHRIAQGREHPTLRDQHRRLHFGFISRQQLPLVLTLERLISRSHIPFTRSAARDWFC